jgi:hypothetical protein
MIHFCLLIVCHDFETEEDKFRNILKYYHIIAAIACHILVANAPCEAHVGPSYEEEQNILENAYHSVTTYVLVMC